MTPSKGRPDTHMMDWARTQSLPDFTSEMLDATVSVFASLGIHSPAVLGESTWEEVLGLYENLCAERGVLSMGPERTQLRVLHTCAANAFFSALNPSSAPDAPYPRQGDDRKLDLIAALVKKGGQGSKRRNSDLDLSDDDDDDEEFQLGGILKDWREPRGSAEAIDSSWFAASKRLSGLHKGGKKAHRKAFLATSGLEDWHPSWLGHGQPSGVKSSLSTTRRKQMNSSPPACTFLGNVSTFWLSHFAVGQTSIAGVLSHLLLLIKMVDEQGLDFARNYENGLLAKLHELQRLGALRHLDEYLPAVDSTLYTTLMIRPARVRDQPPPKVEREPPAPRGGRDRPVKTPEPRVRPQDPEKPLKNASQPPPKPREERRKDVCFSHSPHHGLTCSRKDCTRDHLDTTKEDLLKRYNSAKSAFEASRKPRGGGNRG